MPEACFVCGYNGPIPSKINGDRWEYVCNGCGLVKLTGSVASQIRDGQYRDSAYLLAGQVSRMTTNELTKYQDISSENIEAYLKMPYARKLSEKVDSFLIFMGKSSEHFGGSVVFNQIKMQSVFFAKNGPEAINLYHYMISERYIEGGNQNDRFEYKLTPIGWRRFEDIESKTVKSSQCFVAMSFNDDLKSLFDNAIAKALEDTGFDPFRVDRKEHNDKIDDLIISEIRKSHFVISDVTKHRQGVYFEGGFAMGLDKPVIWSCRSDDLKNAHFDTRQYNHIEWRTEDEMRKKLVNRIRATIPGAK